jgi:hypothetical protein
MGGDWVETYLSSNRVAPAQVVPPVRDYILRAPIERDALSNDPSTLYGEYVDKVMYLYGGDPRDKEVQRYEGGAYTWRQMQSGEVPDRLHMVKAMKFRFYTALTVNSAFVGFNLHAGICGTGSITPGAAAVYAIPVGYTLDKRPAAIAPHHLANFVTFIDPNQ